MVSMTTCGVVVYGRGVELALSADAAVRAGADEILLAGDPSDPIFEAAVRRLRAVAVAASSAGCADAFNAARARATSDLLLFLEAGDELAPDACARAVAAFEARPELVAFCGPILIESDDGLHSAQWTPRAESVLEVLADPRAVPPLFACRLGSRSGELDPGLPGLEIPDLWVRLLAAGAAIGCSPGPLARRRALAPSRWAGRIDSPAYAAVFDRFIRKHERLVADHMQGLLIEREIGFARLRDEHAALLRRRDAALAELAALRAKAAHHRAFLAHHAMDELDWGDLRRPDPVSRDWGYARGGPVDRPYIDAFVRAHASDIRGRVLEVQEGELTARYGGERVSRRDVLDLDAANPLATVVADLRCAPSIAGESYDAVILTQTAHVIDDVEAVLRECHRALAPGGVLLATFPCASRVCLEYGPHGDFWRVTPAGAATLVRRVFGPDVEVQAFGNVLAQVAFLHGLGATELSQAEMAAGDPYNPMLVGVRARRRAARSRKLRRRRGVVLLYHRIDDAAIDELDLNVPPDLFAAHLDALRRECDPIPLHDLLTRMPEDLPERAVAVTFDDGYLDHLRTAAPRLVSRDVPATFFLTSAGLAGGHEYWWDTLERVLIADAQAAAPLTHAGRSWPVDTLEQRRALLRHLHECCVNAAAAERERLVSLVRAWAGDAGTAARRSLTREEARELSAMPGVAIGAHTVNHLLLPRLAPAARQTELREARQAIEQAIGRAVDMCAYPYGGVDAAAANTLRASFAYGVDCEPAAVPVSFDAARVPRIEVRRCTPDDLTARVAQLIEAAAEARPAIQFLP
ncbi:MAG TPA: polysaccharide deacetylase family protein [Dehalococcoidia bacterium]|nr:polysaccharide deacetylase family protein [Dehalococcoidia bacterium]